MASPVSDIEPVDNAMSRPVDPDSSQPVFARSKAYQKLFDEFFNYAVGKIGGGSVLISGHRGSGKTTMVQNAIRDLSSMLSNKQLKFKPFLIPLHGPDLLDINRSAETAATDKAPVGNDKKEQKSNPKPEIDISLSGEKELENKLIKNVLEHVTISLYRALADEFFDTFQQTLRRDTRAADLMELIGLFRLELDESPNISTLREIWSKAGFLKTGMLFKDREQDQGVQEIVLLSSAAQAFRKVAGLVNDKMEMTNDAEMESIYSTDYKVVSKDIINAVFGLISGIAVGAGVFEAVDIDNGSYKLLIGSLAGIVTALLAGFTFTLSSKRSTRKKKSKQYQFIRKNDISSLNRELPYLISRVKKIGLVPIFVVDELDKVIKPPYEDFGNLIGYLKKLVSENSFFCFITDRNYFDFISNVYRVNRYPKEYTYFTHRFYVNYEPRDLHAYLDRLPELQGKSVQDSKADALLMQYLLLNRANLHTIDIKREILKRAENGTINMEGIKSRYSLRFPIMIQLAIESIIEGSDLSERFEQDAYFSQIINDTLYFPLRNWLNGETTLDISKQKFLKYIVLRSGLDLETTLIEALIDSENWAEVEKKMPVSMNDIDFLIEKLTELLDLLLNSDKLYNILNTPEKHTRAENRYQEPGIWNIVIETIPKQIPNNSISMDLALLRKVTGSDSLFEWRFDYFGRSLGFRMEKKGFDEKLNFIKKLNSFFLEFTLNQVGLEQLGRFQIINSTPDWNDLLIVIERVSHYFKDKKEYSDLQPDLQNLEEYYTMITSKGETLAKSFMLAHFLIDFTRQNRWDYTLSVISSSFNMYRGESQGFSAIDDVLADLDLINYNWDKYVIHPAGFNKWKADFEIITTFKIPIGKNRKEIRNEWWENWRSRFIEIIIHGTSYYRTSIIDLICIMENYNYAAVLGKGVGNVDKWEWTEMLISGVKSGDLVKSRTDIVKGVKEMDKVLSNETPSWLVIPSLLQLEFLLSDYEEFQISDEQMKEAALNLQASIKSPEGNYLLIISDKLPGYYFPFFQAKTPLLPIRIRSWIQEKEVIAKIVSILNKKYNTPTLVADLQSSDADRLTREIGAFLRIDPGNIYRMAPPSVEKIESEFKVIRSLDELGYH